MSTSLRSWTAPVASILLAGAIGWYLPALVASDAPTRQPVVQLEEFQLPEMAPPDSSLAALKRLDAVGAMESKERKAGMFLAANQGKPDPLEPVSFDAADVQGYGDELWEFQMACGADLQELEILAIMNVGHGSNQVPSIRYWWHGDKHTDFEGLAKPIYSTSKRFESGVLVRAEYFVERIDIDRVTFIMSFDQLEGGVATMHLDSIRQTHRLKFNY